MVVMMMTISTVSAVDERLQSMVAVDDLEKMVMSSTTELTSR